MDQKAMGIVDPLLYTDEEMESVEVHRRPPKVFDLFKILARGQPSRLQGQQPEQPEQRPRAAIITKALLPGCCSKAARSGTC